MHDTLLAVLFGAVQGLSEFLPISSSGHLVLLHSIADLRINNDLAFDVMLHLGTLVAVVSYFWRDLLSYIRGFFLSLAGKKTIEGNLAWWLLAATIPAAILGYILESKLEAAIRQPMIVAAVLIFGGLLLWWVDATAKRHEALESLGWKKSVVVGLAQALALVPGFSRSGATIMASRLLGLGRRAAARFSFLLSVPIIAGAGLKSVMDISGSETNLGVWVAGLLSAAVVGYLAIGWMMKYIQRGNYRIFAFYRIAIGIAALIYFGLRK